MKCIFLLTLFAFTLITCKKSSIRNRKLIVPKVPSKCSNIKCPAIEKPICVKIKYKNEKFVNKTTYILMVNQCELEYMKCYQDIEGFVVPMKNCNHKLGPKTDKGRNAHRRNKRSARFEANMDDDKFQEKTAIKSKKVDNVKKEVNDLKNKKKKPKVELKIENKTKNNTVKKTSKISTKNATAQSGKGIRRHQSDFDVDIGTEKPGTDISAIDGGYRAKLKLKGLSEQPLSDIESSEYYKKRLHYKGKSSDEESHPSKEAIGDETTDNETGGDGLNSDKSVTGDESLEDKKGDSGDVGSDKALDSDAGGDEATIKKGAISDEKVIDKDVVGDEKLIDSPVIGDDKALDSGVIGDKPVLNNGVIGDERVIDKGAIGDPQSKGVIGDERLIDKTVIAKGVLDKGVIDKGVIDKGVIDQGVIGKGVIGDDRMFSEPMFGSGLEIIGSDDGGGPNKLNQDGSSETSDADQTQNDVENSPDALNDITDDDSRNGDDDDSHDVSQAGDDGTSDQNNGSDDEKGSQELDEDCPTSCPQRNVMVCGRCKEGVYRTFLSVCHLRMFACHHPDEGMELISRVPCAMSAPYIAPDLNMEPEGKANDPSDDDRILRFIRCREKGLVDTSWEKLLGPSPEKLKLKGDKKCYFEETQKLKKKYDYSSFEYS